MASLLKGSDMTPADQHPADSPVSRETVPGYWGFGSLTSPLVRSEQTHGAYSIVEQLMPANSGPPPHIHAQSDEVFYILEGAVHLQLGDSVSLAEAGQLVRVPLGVPHAFAVQSAQVRMLIFFMPATMDQFVTMLSAPATELTVPPPGPGPEPSEQQMADFMNHLREAASLSWSEQQDLLTQFRQPPSP
jgi:mannose-6-phosphate isomerase-like protein (cupin superfamily)